MPFGIGSETSPEPHSRRPNPIEVSSSSTPAPQPLHFREDLLREVACDICSRATASTPRPCLPGLRGRNIHVIQARAGLVNQQSKVVRKTEVGNRELAYRLLGNAHEDVLTASSVPQGDLQVHRAEAGGRPRDGQEALLEETRRELLSETSNEAGHSTSGSPSTPTPH